MKQNFVILANKKLLQFWENRKKGFGTVFSRVSFHNKISISDNFDQDLVVAWHNWHCLYLLSLCILPVDPLDHDRAARVLDSFQLGWVVGLVVLCHQDGLGPVATQDPPGVTAIWKDDVLAGNQDAHGRRAWFVFTVGHFRNLSEMKNLDLRTISTFGISRFTRRFDLRLRF